MHEPPGERPPAANIPNLAQIAGHALSNIFLDCAGRRTSSACSASTTPEPAACGRHGRCTSLRPIDVLVIAPSKRLDDLAAKHIGSLPAPIRAMLRGVGVSGRGDDARGAALASYLLFESGYTRELLALGRADTYARRDEVMRFFGWQPKRRVPSGGAESPALATAS
jgi:NTE family protein